MALVSIGSIDDFPEGRPTFAEADGERLCVRSEEHTSELQSH